MIQERDMRAKQEIHINLFIVWKEKDLYFPLFLKEGGSTVAWLSFGHHSQDYALWSVYNFGGQW